MKIVVGYLPTPEGRAALERAIDEAELRHGELVVAHTFPHGNRAEVTADRTELESVKDRLQEAGVQHMIRGLARGNSPAEDLLAVAEEVGADLIVLGIRHRSPVGKLILGSNAQHVIMNAPCAVLCVRSRPA